MTDERDYTVGSGNIYADLGFAEPEIEQAKANLVRLIARAINDRGLTQVQAGTVLGIGQPKVSALLRGRLEGFTTDRLLKLLNRLDYDVEITPRPKVHPTRAARIVVHPISSDAQPMAAAPTKRSKSDGVQFS